MDSSPGGNLSIVIPNTALPVFGISISFQADGVSTSPDNDQPGLLSICIYNNNGIYKFWLSELITHIDYLNMAKLEDIATRDVAFEAEGRTLEALFRDAAVTFEVMVDRLKRRFLAVFKIGSKSLSLPNHLLGPYYPLANFWPQLQMRFPAHRKSNVR